MSNYELQPPIDPEEELVIDYHFTDDEEMQIERRMDVRHFSRHDAEQDVLRERPSRLFGEIAVPKAVQLAELRETPHYSRRGGRALPEVSDSEGDPNWNTPTGEPWTEEQQANYDAFRNAEDVRENAIKYLMQQRNLPEIQAIAILRARDEKRQKLRQQQGLK